MEKDDKGSTLIRIGVSGWKFLLVPAYPGCPGSKAVKRSLFVVECIVWFLDCYINVCVLAHVLHDWLVGWTVRLLQEGSCWSVQWTRNSSDYKRVRNHPRSRGTRSVLIARFCIHKPSCCCYVYLYCQHNCRCSNLCEWVQGFQSSDNPSFAIIHTLARSPSEQRKH